MTASFDIFDTCLTRLCGTPAQLFDVLSYRAFSEAVPESLRQRFVAERLEAEYNATVQLGAATTLSDIYDAISFTHPKLLSKERLMENEMACERAMLRPVLSVREQIEKFRNKGALIIFISDMYLPGAFLEEVLTSYGFMKSGDSLYVSCEAQKFKYGGKLFSYVKEKENLKTRHWTHYGDNQRSDIKGAGCAGIKARQIRHSYSPVQQLWLDDNNVRGFKYPGILAGISRGLRYSNEDNSHKDIVLDLISPLLCSYVYMVMKDAAEKGFKRLYFCSRDTCSMFSIAQKMQHLYSDLEVRYLYVSRDALYLGDDEPKIAYFSQEGLATKADKVAIVDLITGGKTMEVLNALLERNDYRKVYGFFLCKWEHFDIPVDYEYSQFELSEAYLKAVPGYGPLRLLIRTQFFENFFGLNNQCRTIGYKNEHGQYSPVFSKETTAQDGVIPDREKWFEIHQSLIDQFTDAYLETECYRYSDEIFNLSINALLSFADKPCREYLEPLLDYRIACDARPFIKRESLPEILVSRGHDTEWRWGTYYYNLPQWMISIIRRIRKK